MYSQNAEEEAILKACSSVKPQRFLDLGAYHPTDLSNTRALYEAGWSGVMVEPNPSNMLFLVEEYGAEPRIDLIQAAIDVEPGLRLMALNGALTSATAEAVEGTIWIPNIALRDLLTQFDAGFGFVNIDIEGRSQAVCFELLEITKGGIYCICVEWCGDNKGLLTRMTAAGYRLIYASEENGVFAR